MTQTQDIEAGKTYSHVLDGKHLRMVLVLSVEGDTATVRAIAGSMAGMEYEIETSALVRQSV